VVLERLPETSALDKNRPASLDMIVTFDGSQRSVVMYPCRNYEILNCAVIVRDSMLKTKTTESWSAPGDREEMLSNVQDFPSWVLDILKLARDDIKLWQLRDQDPLPSYIKGRTVLIGDAAHPMTPHQGQGATQAIEDTEGFLLFNDPDITRENVPNLLKDFDSVRRPRASRIQEITRWSANRKTPEEVHAMAKYNWTYPGIVEGLRRVKAGEDLVQF
jgi:salicylate hydroxylase